MSIDKHSLDVKTESSLEKLADMVRHIDALMEEAVGGVQGIIPTEMLIPILLHRKVLEKADAIFVNIDNGTEHVSKGIMRTMFENLVYLAYMLKSNTGKKAEAYYYGSLKSCLSVMQVVEPSTSKSKVMADFLGTDLKQELPDATIISEIKKMKDKLDAPWLKDTRKAWVRLERTSRKHVNWYALFGHDSIRKVAIDVNMQAEYELLYSVYSLEIHTINAMEMIEHRQGKSFYTPLRSYTDPETLIVMAKTFLWTATDLILKAFFSAEQMNFNGYCLKNHITTPSILAELEKIRKANPSAYDEAVKKYRGDSA